MQNFGYYLCQKKRYPEANAMFDQALAVPRYRESRRTLLTKGVCHAFAGQLAESEASLVRAYAIDPANPSISVNLSEVLYRRGDYERARFYIRRVNAVPTLARRADAVAGGAHRAAPGQPHRRAGVRRPTAPAFPRLERGRAVQPRPVRMSDAMPESAAAAPPRPTTAGGLLRQARQAQGLHIAALAAAIKVVPRKLELLESDQFDQLPDATFTRALAQTVCRTLKIDAAPILALLPPPSGHRLGSRSPRAEHAVPRAPRTPGPEGVGERGDACAGDCGLAADWQRSST